MNTRKSLYFGSAFAALMCASAVYANTTDSLVVTELSPTDLTAVWNGTDTLTVINTSQDDWRFSTPDLLTGAGQWVDPNAGKNVNQVGAFLGLFGGAAADVGPSGFLSFLEGAPLANDTANTTDFYDLNGHVDVTFNDEATTEPNGGGTGLPDATTTLPLLGMAFAGLCGFAKRFRK